MALQYTLAVGADRLRIAEIFASIQGEGGWVGIPSVFVRVSGCNLRCRWCDTPYASWNPEGPTMAIDEIVDVVKRFDVEHVVLTGGEPMLFDAIIPLAEHLKSGGHTITVETAGTVFRKLPCDLMSISPKLGNSTPDKDSGWYERHEASRCNLEALRNLTDAYRFQLKFVVDPDARGDFDEIRALLGALPNVHARDVHLMAEGTDSETLHRRERDLVSVCMAEGWRLTPRFHVDLFGNTRGT